MMKLCTILLALSAICFAQNARLSGTVTDNSGAVISGAAISALHVETGVARSTLTNEQGYYVLPSLQPGAYRLTVQAPGFKQHTRDQVVLTVNQVSAMDIQMELGQVSDSVTVTADALALDTATAALGNVVNNRQVADLPLNRRQGLGFMLLMPNVRPGPNYDPTNWANSLQISVNGARDRSMELLFDGTPALAVGPTAAAAALPAYSPSVESIREFRLVTNSLAAEYGNTSAGMVSVVSKSGTNELHGSAYNYLRNSALDANNFFNNRSGIPLNSFKRNQYGATLGGPLWIPGLYNGRNRTFFFVAYEGLRSATGANVNRTVPTAAMREGDFSGLRNAAGQAILVYDPLTTSSNGSGGYMRLPFAGNRVPSTRVDPVARRVMALWPEPNSPGLPFTQANNFVLGSASQFDSDQFDYRVDHRANERHSMYGRYSHGANVNTPPRPFGRGDGQARALKTRNLAYDYTWVKSSASVVNGHFGYSRLGDTGSKPGYKIDEFGFNDKFVQSVGTVFNGVPQFNVTDMSQLDMHEFLWNSPFTTFQASGSMTHTRGRHTIKAGAEGRRYYYSYVPTDHYPASFNFDRSLTQGPDPLRATSTAGWGFASFLLGAGSGTTAPMASIPKNMVAPSWAGYIQDDWKVSTKLTLNLGLRYDLFVPRTAENDELSWFDIGAPNPLSRATGLNLAGGLQFAGQNGNGRQQTRTAWKNFGPRFGFAYQAAPRLVLRGGFGILYPQPTNSIEASGSEGFFTQTNWLSSVDGLYQQSTLQQAFATGLSQATRGQLGLLELAGQSFTSKVPAHFESTYNSQWHFSIQSRLAGDSQAEISYVGNRGVHLPFSSVPLNQLRTDQLALGSALLDRVPNPFFGLITSGALAGQTTTRGQLLRPFPHFDSINSAQPAFGNSIYHGLGLRFEQRSRYGHMAQLSYTAAKTIDDASAMYTGSVQDAYNLRAERAVSAQDISQRLVVSGLAPLPFGKGQPLFSGMRGISDALFGGWQVTGIFSTQTGVPLQITAPNTSGSLGGGQRPDATGVSAALPGRVQDRLNRYFDTAQFVQPAPFRFGNAPRTLPNVRGPRLTALDATLMKTFSLKERAKAQLRAEAFNLTNTPAFGLPGQGFNTPTFGVITSQANTPRQVQLALRIDF